MEMAVINKSTTTSTYKSFIRNRFAEIVKSSNIAGHKTTVFLKGFPLYTLQIMLEDNDDIDNFSYLLKGNVLDLDSIEAQVKMFLIDLMSSNEDITICLYEQYLSVSDTINAGRNIIDRDFIIIENNLFHNFFPSCISQHTLSKLRNYFESEKTDTDNDIEKYCKYYADVDSLTSTELGVKYVNKYKDEKIPVIDFFNQEILEFSQNKSFGGIEIEVSSDKFTSYLINIQTTGKCIPATFITESINASNASVLSCICNLLSTLKVNFQINYFNHFEEFTNAKFDHYLPILRKYWGETAEFRMLQFYKDPNRSNDIVEISQENVIADIIEQGEKCLNNSNDYKNIFITAPTGAGKSVLFQIPAIHLANDFNAVTIVITPLIALMKDQVDNLENMGVRSATYINSSLSFEEKEQRIIQIKNGSKSIIYLAPEMLLSNSLESLLGSRKIGLFVIDEAHIVTSWGKDFRADYWFLGDYLLKSKRQGITFPILCLTATAVYGGMEDVVNETIASLSLSKTVIYLGSVKRNNISFDFKQISKKDIVGNYEQDKINRAINVIEKYAIDNKKSLIYCPYTTQVKEIMDDVPTNIKDKVGMYHGQLPKNLRTYYQEKFKSDDLAVMICTKAFGMGIDVSNISDCYHFAPTGNLADYVQEIGRIARSTELQGVAKIDFFKSDLKYIRILHGISGLKQYQLKEMIRKIYDIYSIKQKRNLLIAPDVFSYLFGDDEIENKVKNGLLLISKDLEQKYGFPVINVRPKTMFTKSYVCVAEIFEKEFTTKYHDVIRKLLDSTKTIVKSKNPEKYSDTIITNGGNIYEVDMSKIWEREFSELTFADFKRRFFDGGLFSSSGDKQLWPRVRIKINYKKNFDETYNKFELFLVTLTQIFTELKEAGSLFTFEDFNAKIKAYFADSDIDINADFTKLIFELFILEVVSVEKHYKYTDPYRFIQAKRSTSSDSMVYRIIGTNHLYLINRLLSLLTKNKPFTEDNTFIAFISVTTNGKKPEVMKLLNLLELLNFASYEIRGGANMEVFVRINDPMKLRYLSNGKYSNNVLRDIDQKRKYSQRIVQNFFAGEYTTQERWSIIENYFLGNDEYLQHLFHFEENEV